MTQDSFPITPPPGLIKNWCASRIHEKQDVSLHVHVAIQAARWGADQELEACCQEVHDWYGNGSRLRAARRPKPPSLKDKLKKAIYTENLGEALRLVEQLDDSL